MANDRIRSRNGYYSKNRDLILEKKKIYNEKNKVRIAEYHKQYYLDHKEELNRKHTQWNRKRIKKNASVINGKSQFQKTTTVKNVPVI
jgi:predicted Holliday junction resolvase-like endonuclease